MPLSVFHGRCPSLSLSQPCILLHTSWLDSSARIALHDLAEVENSNSAGSSLNKRLGGRGGVPWRERGGSGTPGTLP